jgi:3-oxosteroid 1-dehydrogenase
MAEQHVDDFDLAVDVLVAGSGAGGMTAALAARANGFDTLVVEKSSYYGGSTALSGGGIWAPSARALIRDGYSGTADQALTYMKSITRGIVTEARLISYIENSAEVLDFLEAISKHLEFVWRPGYSDYYPDVPGGSSVGRSVNVPPIRLRKLGEDLNLMRKPEGQAPKGIWIGPKELRDFYTLRQSWKGKRLLLRLIGRWLRAIFMREKIAVIGQSLVARLRLAMREQSIPLWLNSSLKCLITDSSGAVIGAVTDRDGREVRIHARLGVILATGGFEHNTELRAAYQPHLHENWSLGNPASNGDGLLAATAIGAATELMDEAWWYPVIAWPDGRRQMLLNERMLPNQLVVNGKGERFYNESAPYGDFVHAMFDGERAGVSHVPSWLIMDSRAWRRYIVAGHLPLPRIPFAPVPTGRRVPKAWLDSGQFIQARDLTELAEKIGVPVIDLQRTVDRFNHFARVHIDADFHRGESMYNNYYGDNRLPNPNLAPVAEPPYLAIRMVTGDLGTNGGLLTDEHAHVLDSRGKPIRGLYATGNVTSTVMGRSYAGAGATIGPAMAFAYAAVKHMRDAPHADSKPGPPGISAAQGAVR